jgi:hypothetical protein
MEKEYYLVPKIIIDGIYKMCMQEYEDENDIIEAKVVLKVLDEIKSRSKIINEKQTLYSHIRI